MLTLSDIPAVATAAEDLISKLTGALAPNSPGGKKVTRAELIGIMGSAGKLITTIAVALAN